MNRNVIIFTNEVSLSNLITVEKVKSLHLDDLKTQKCVGFKQTFMPIEASHGIIVIYDYEEFSTLNLIPTLIQIVEGADELFVLYHSKTLGGPKWIEKIRNNKAIRLIPGSHDGGPGEFYHEVFVALLYASRDDMTEYLIELLTGDPILEGKLSLLHYLLEWDKNIKNANIEETEIARTFGRYFPNKSKGIKKDKYFEKSKKEFISAYRELNEFLIDGNKDEFRTRLSQLRDLWLNTKELLV